MNATPNSNGDHKDDRRRPSDDDDDEEEDDRKPPAKEIHVVTRSDRRNRQRRRNNDSSSNLTNDTASISSWTSPFAARLPNSSSSESLAEYTPNKKQNSEIPPLAALTPFSSMKGRSPRNQQLGTPQKKPQALANIQVVLSLWVSTTLLSATFLAYVLLPSMALSTLAFMLVSSIAFMQTLISTSRRLYQEAVVHGNGLGSLFLPESINQLLTQTTMHEYLTNSDSSAMDDFQYLALYFLPLTPAQRDAALARLTPAHHNRVHQSGLGHWLMGPNSDNWRLLVGNQRYYQERRQAIDIPGGPLQTVIEAGVDDQDDTSSSTLISDDMVGGGSEQQGTGIALRLALADDAQRNGQDENAIVPNSSDELDVLYDAIWTSAMSTVFNPFVQTVQQTMWPVAVVSTAMTGLAAGVTMMVRGNRRRNDSSWMVILGGGATVVMSMVGARYGLGSMLTPRENNEEKKKKDSTPRSSKK